MKNKNILQIEQQKKTLRFGDFIVAVYDACGKRRAGAVVRLAINARLLVFQGQQQIVIS